MNLEFFANLASLLRFRRLIYNGPPGEGPVSAAVAMPDLDSFGEIGDRLRAGDPEAAAEVFDRFALRLIALARSRLDTRLRRKLDPDDVMQSVFRTFFARQQKGGFILDGWNGLWALLVRITLRKCCRQAEVYRAARRDVRREQNQRPDQAESVFWAAATAREPTPEEATVLSDTLGNVLNGLDPVQQQMVVLRLQGYSIPEISKEVGRAERTVSRLLSLVRDGLARREEARV